MGKLQRIASPRRSCLWRRLLLLLALFLLLTLLGHFLLEASGVTVGSVGMAELHTSILLFAASLCVCPFLQNVPGLYRHLAPAGWSPPIRPRPPVHRL